MCVVVVFIIIIIIVSIISLHDVFFTVVRTRYGFIDTTDHIKLIAGVVSL
jgi:hypothetical protein